jgi:hypothetical protein
MIPKVSNTDILRAFLEDVPAAEQRELQRKYVTHDDRRRVHAEFKQMWIDELGQVFECPSDDDLFTFLKISKWDMQLIGMAVEDLRARAKHPFDPARPHEHAMKHFSAALIRRVRSRYGPPPSLERAA